MAERSSDYYYTTAEVRERIDALEELELLQLREKADILARGVQHYDGGDLLQEMMTRMVEGTRQWPRGMPLGVALIEDVKSLCSQYRDHEEVLRKHGAKELLASEAFSFGDGNGDAHAALASRHVDGDTPLELLCAEEVIPAIETLFSDSVTAQLIIMAWAEDKQKPEIMKDLKISETEYDSTRRLIARRMVSLRKQ